MPVLDELKEETTEEPVSPEDDFSDEEDDIQDYIEEYLQYPVDRTSQTDETEYPDNKVLLHFRPILSLTSITIDGVAELTADYRLSLKQGLISKIF